MYKGGFAPKNEHVNLEKLMYIGESGDIKDRHIKGYEHDNDIQNEIRGGVTNGCVIYATAKLNNEDDRKRVENAIIYHEQPDINTDGKDCFNHPDTQVISKGMHKFLDPFFIVENTN